MPVPLFSKPLSDITEADLVRLIDDGEREGKTIDYKRDVIGNSDNDKKEFLYDVSSFANTSGGHLVIGMAEDQGLPTRLGGLPGVDPDKETARIEQIVRDGLRPPLSGLECKIVDLTAGSVAMVVRISKSWNPPHQVTFQKSFRFYGRDTNAKYQLDVEELRSLFGNSDRVAERLRNFRVARIAKIMAGETPAHVESHGCMITHLLPLSAFSLGENIDIAPFYRDHSTLIAILGYSGRTRFNIDGLLTSTAPDVPNQHYVQLYRNGCLEVARSWKRYSSDREIVPSHQLEEQLVFQIKHALELFRRTGVQPPIVLFVTLVGMKGWQMANSGHFQEAYGSFDRDPIYIPEVILEHLDGDEAGIAQPAIDMIWNASGWPKSPNYDNDGKWRANKRQN